MYVYWVICSFREVAPVKPAFSDSLYSLPEERGNGGGRGQTQRTRASETRFPLIRLDDYIVRRKEKKKSLSGGSSDCCGSFVFKNGSNWNHF